MAEPMKLNNILADLKNVGPAGIEKAAAAPEAETPSVNDARGELLAALQDVDLSEKTAAPAAEAQSAVEGVRKIASDMATSEAAALQKEAEFYGAAVADGFMARLGQYENAAPVTKVASDGVPTDADFEKFAAENPGLTKQAMELGYRDGQNQVEMLKQAAYEQGYADTLVQIEELSKTAEGQEVLRQIAAEIEGQDQVKVASELEKWAQTEEGREAMPIVRQGYQDTMEKLSAFQQGYQDTANEINKIASDTFARGFNDTIAVLQAM